MHFLWVQLGRFWHWVQQGGNVNIVLVAVTTVYVALTWRIMRATARQAAAILQPVLSLKRVTLIEEGRTNHYNVFIENLGTQPVVFLDVELSCFPHGHQPIVKSRWYEDHILSVKGSLTLPFNFRQELEAIHVSQECCGYRISIVVSDLSRQVVAEYEFFPVTGHVSCRVGYPVIVRWKNFLHRWRWRYYRAEPLIKEVKRWAEWENSESRRSQENK